MLLMMMTLWNVCSFVHSFAKTQTKLSTHSDVCAPHDDDGNSIEMVADKG